MLASLLMRLVPNFYSSLGAVASTQIEVRYEPEYCSSFR